MPGAWIDISVPLADGMVHWPDNPPVAIHRALDRDRGDACNVSALSLGAQSGTHVDAPIHFVDGGVGIQALDVSVGMGPARVVGVDDPRAVTADLVASTAPEAGERILFKTANSARPWWDAPFEREAVHLDADASALLAEAGVALVGIDYLSVGGFTCGNADAAHRPLLERGVWILEGLDLSAVDRGPHELVCIPLRIDGCDASPVRALLR